MITEVLIAGASGEADNKIVIVGKFTNILNFIPYVQLAVKYKDGCPIDYLICSSVDLIIIPYHAKMQVVYEAMGVWELLLKIRITKSENQRVHVCIIGNLPLEMVLRLEERALLMGSNGVSYLRLPEKLSQELIKEKIGDNATEENTRSFISKLVEIRRLRHSYANVWGLDRLMEIHKKYYSDYNWQPGDKYDDDKKIKNSLGYQMAEYVFLKNEDIIEPQWKTSMAVNGIKRVVALGQQINVLFIDDKAESGWLSVLTSLLSPVKIICMPIDDYNNDDLIKKFEDINKNNKINVIISDLRLYLHEEQEIDYNKLKSIQLMKYVYDDDEYEKVQYILFTASNQLMNYKNVILSKYAPAGIYLKEGFDLIINSSQHDENYRNLLNSLSAALNNSINAKYRKLSCGAAGRVDNNDPEELSAVAYVDRYMNTKQWNIIYEKMRGKLKQYDHVLVDTCIFYRYKEPFIALCNSDKVRCIYPVYREMERISITRENTYRKYAASMTCSMFQNNIYKEQCLTLDQINEIDKKFKEGKQLENLADNYFLPSIINILHKNNNEKVLFITNDNRPFSRVLKWAKQNHAKNVQVMRSGELYQECGIKIPNTVQIMGFELSKNKKAYFAVLSDGTKIDIAITTLVKDSAIKSNISDYEYLVGREYGYLERKELKKQIIDDCLNSV